MRSVLSSLVALGLLVACGADSGTKGGDGGASSDSGAGGVSTSRGGSTSSGGRATGSGGALVGGRGGASNGGGSVGDGGASGDSGAGAGGVNGGIGGAHDDAGVDSGTSAGGAAGGGNDGGTGGVDADAGREAGAGGAPAPVVIDIVPGKTAFREYGKLRIGFAQAVDASTLKIALSPVQPAALAVTQVTVVDATTIDAALAYYHLPRDYQLTVSGKLADGASFTASATISGANNGSRIAFLTKQTGSADFKSWPNAPASAKTPLEAADGICGAEAAAAGFHGTFAAFLSAQGTYDAGCRLFGKTGTVANHCGQASMPVEQAPWLDVSGLPIARGGTAVVADAWDLPIRFSADGTQPFHALVWTGSEAGAVGGGSDCTGWTSTTAFASMAIFLDEYLLTYDGGSSCSDNRSLACFQVKGTFFGPSTLHQVQGKRVFVTKKLLGGAMDYATLHGVDAADALCKDEATTAGYANAAAFHAYLGSSTADALCHVLGKTGTVAGHCGLPALPTDVSWRRTDDYPIGDAAQLVADELTAPIVFGADGTRHLKDRPWTGVSEGPAPQTCSDWTSSTGDAYVGSPRTTSGWQFYSTAKCNTAAPVYCFEQ